KLSRRRRYNRSAMRALVSKVKRTVPDEPNRAPRDLCNLVLKGLQDSAWGFDPRKMSRQRPALKGRQTNRSGLNSALCRQTKISRPYRAGRALFQYLGL